MEEKKPKLVLFGGTVEHAESVRRSVGEACIVEWVPSLAAIAGETSAGSITDQAWPVRLLDIVGEGVAVVAPSGEPVWANEMFKELDAAACARVAELCRAVSSRRAGLSSRTEILQTAAHAEVGSADENRWWEVAVSPLAGSRASNLVVVVRDVTAEHRMRQRLEAINRAGEDLLSFDAETLRLHPVERLRLAQEKVIRCAAELLHFDHFAIRLLERKTDRLGLVMQHGMPPEFDDIEIHARAEGNGTSGLVAATGRSYIVYDVSADPLFLPGLPGARSSLTVPLKLGEKVIGIMDVESRRPGAFTEEDKHFGEVFARHVALALHTLDLLVVERSTTHETASKRVETELGRPLDDLLRHLDAIARGGELGPGTVNMLGAAITQAEAARESVRALAAGSQTVFDAAGVLKRAEQDPALKGRRVLVADDEARVRKVIGDVLRHHGSEVVVCDSGSAAIETLESARRGEIPGFDLVLSDIKMPDKNGYDVFAAAKRVRADLPVILMTGFGYDPHHSIVRASQEGCRQVLFKPFEASSLLDEARKALTTPG